MMTPKEKAMELVDRYLDIENYNNLDLDLFCDECGVTEQSAKYMSLIAVDEILKGLNNDNIIYGSEYRYEISNYYENVKKELERL